MIDRVERESLKATEERKEGKGSQKLMVVIFHPVYATWLLRPQPVRTAAKSEAMTKRKVVAISTHLQTQRQWLSAMPLQPLFIHKY